MTLTLVLQGLVVYPENIMKEVVLSRGCYASSAAKEFLAEHGERPAPERSPRSWLQKFFSSAARGLATSGIDSASSGGIGVQRYGFSFASGGGFSHTSTDVADRRVLR